MELSGYIIMGDNVDTFKANSICNMMYLVTDTHLNFRYVILHVTINDTFYYHDIILGIKKIITINTILQSISI
jgi:hypothetical protein